MSHTAIPILPTVVLVPATAVKTCHHTGTLHHRRAWTSVGDVAVGAVGRLVGDVKERIWYGLDLEMTPFSAGTRKYD